MYRVFDFANTATRAYMVYIAGSCSAQLVPQDERERSAVDFLGASDRTIVACGQGRGSTGVWCRHYSRLLACYIYLYP